MTFSDSAAQQNARPAFGSGLSEEETEFLITSGAFTAEELAETQREIAEGLLIQQELGTRLGAINRTIDSAEAAEKLQVTQEEISGFYTKGILYGFNLDGRTLYPTWQFPDGENKPLPNLVSIIKNLYEGFEEPASVEGFMTTPKENLTWMTPIEWLEKDGDPAKIIGIIDSFLMS